MTEFMAFPKMARLSRECIVTEKIDGTNAQVHIVSRGDVLLAEVDPALVIATNDCGDVMLAGSRSRYITPGSDNFGFAAWVRERADELWALGMGRHFGEWWGAGIQRGYGLTEKRFSLFNVSRWASPGASVLTEKQERAPQCCDVVPLLRRGLFDTRLAAEALEYLQRNGSAAAPGFMRPEGVVVYHVAAGTGFKKTLEKDEEPKSRAAAATRVEA